MRDSFPNFCSLISEPVRVTSDPFVIGKLVNATDGRQYMVLIIYKLGSSSLNVGRRYGVDAAENICRGHPSSVRQNLPANIFGNVRVAI